MNTASPIAASWDIAWRLVRGCPELQVYETHPGGGTYDCLTLVSRNIKIDINRVGSIHIRHSPAGAAHPMFAAEQWMQRSQGPGGTQQLADEILEFCRVAKQMRVPSARETTYRIIARLLASRQYDDAKWDARSQFLDTADGGGGLRWPVPSVEMSQIPANEIWVIVRDESRPVAWLWDGWLWSPSGERLNLYGRFQSNASIDSLVSLVTDRTVRQGRALPTVRTRGEQPIGSWPESTPSP